VVEWSITTDCKSVGLWPPLVRIQPNAPKYMKYRVLLFYKYTTITDTSTLMERERSVCEVLNLKGRIIIAEEGINGTVEGSFEDTEKYIAHLKSDKRFKNMNIKESDGIGNAFPRLSVRVRKEIVGTKFPDHIDPRKNTGKYLDPSEFNKWYREDKDFVVVDMRNDYELASGVFDKTVDLGLKNSRDLPAAIEKLKIHKDKTLVTVCTGGVRCEKMSAYLLDQGFENVWQLHNGMHGYMEKFPGEDFKGTLYTFDGRVTMHFGDGEKAKREIVGKCKKCGVASETYYDIHEDGKRIGADSHVILCDDCAKVSDVVQHRSDVIKDN